MINMIGLLEKLGPVAAIIITVGIIIYLHSVIFKCSDMLKKSVSSDDDEDEDEFISFYEDDDESADNDAVAKKNEEEIDMSLIRNRLYVLIQALFDLNRYDDGKCIICYDDAELQDWFHITTVLFQNDILYVKIDYDREAPVRSRIERACYVKLHHDTEQAELFRNETNISVYGNEIKSTDIQLCNALFEISMVGVAEDYGY